MRILLLSDGIPGHVNQAKGLILHITENLVKNKLVVYEKVIPLKFKWMRFILRTALNRKSILAAFIINLAYNDKIEEKSFDLIISAGGNTSFLNAYMAKQMAIPNIFIGSLRGLNSSMFTVVMTLESIAVENNIIMPFAPSLTTFKSTTQAAKKSFGDSNDASTWLMIIGGDGAKCKYDENDWKFLAEAMQYLAHKYGVKWLLTTSRRTGLENEKMLKKFINKNILERVVWYNHQPQKVMQAYLGRSSQVFCTVDSMSMLTESISSCTKTTALLPEQHNMTERYQAALKKMEFNNLLTRVSIKELKSEKNIWMKNISDTHSLKDKVDQSYSLLSAELSKYHLFSKQ